MKKLFLLCAIMPASVLACDDNSPSLPELMSATPRSPNVFPAYLAARFTKQEESIKRIKDIDAPVHRVAERTASAPARMVHDDVFTDDNDEHMALLFQDFTQELPEPEKLPEPRHVALTRKKTTSDLKALDK